MVDSRQKGARAEAAAKKLLIEFTGLDWQRTPGSGALNVAHKLKGDLYIPQEKNKFCIEVKHYKDDHFTSKILTDKDPQIITWWTQAKEQADKTNQLPLLIFKFDRSKWFVAFNYWALESAPLIEYRSVHYFHNKSNDFYIAKLEDWLIHEEVEFIL